ncbi:MAG: hybrid sensor histidine kinase/response regulator [Cytophagales bacterium]|nr:hybrid sensor histidine kinase/response regulator [Cytophagales bacterium]
MSRPKQYHILYVDDEAENLLVFKSTFRLEYRIFTATSAAEALQMLEWETIHLVITDQKMPVMDGVAFLREVARRYPDVIRLILTGYSDLETVVVAVNECGIYRYLTKPWQEEELKQTLENALETCRLRDENQQLLERLSAANQYLEARVAQRTAELVALNEEKNLLIGLVAHDLRGPVGRVNALVDMVRLESHNLTPEQHDCLQMILESNEHLLSLIDRILDVEAIEAGRFTLSPERLDVAALLHEQLAGFKAAAARKHIALESPGPGQPVPGTIDRNFFTQIVENLLSNALKFSYPGSQVCVRLRTDEAWLYLEVQDEGPGLSAADHARLFGKFQRLSARPTGGEPSSGLGLSIVKKYVELMQGKVWCESEKGKGATFVVQLPAQGLGNNHSGG